MDKQIFKLLVCDYNARRDVVNALVESGYMVWVEEEQEKPYAMRSDIRYWVCCKLPEGVEDVEEE